MNDDELKTLFSEECAEMLGGVAAQIAQCRSGSDAGEAWNSLYRAAHTIKGSSGLLGFPATCGFAETLEAAIGEIRRGERTGDAENIDIVESGFAMLAAHVAAIDGGPPPEDGAIRAALAPKGLHADDTAAPVASASADDLSFDLDALIGSLDTGHPSEKG